MWGSFSDFLIELSSTGQGFLKSVLRQLKLCLHRVQGRGLKLARFSKAKVDPGFSRERVVVAVALTLQINGACTQKFEI